MRSNSVNALISIAVVPMSRIEETRGIPRQQWCPKSSGFVCLAARCTLSRLPSLIPDVLHTGGIMKIASRAVLLAFFALGLAQFSAAQMGMGMSRPPDIAGVFSPEVGAGGAYEMVKKDGQK